MFVPNGSFYYNTENKKLFAGQVDENGFLILEPRNPIKLGDHTFNLVKKRYWVDPMYRGSEYHRAQEFPTLATTEAVSAALRAELKKFPRPVAGDYVIDVLGNPETPTRFDETVYLQVTNPDSGVTSLLHVGEAAVQDMLYLTGLKAYILDNLRSNEVVPA